jgi:hypothetical protein
MMKLLLLAALLAVASPKGKGPVIVRQVSSMVMHEKASPTWERHIVVKNPRNEAIWFWIECESQLTSVAIGQPGRHTSEYVFPDIPPGEQCMIHHWQVQQGTNPPPEWRP